LRRLGDNTLAMTLADAQVNLIRPPGFVAALQAANVRQTYLQQFAALDRENQGYVNRKQVEGPMGGFLRLAFELGDRDEDGKLTKAELEAFADLLAGAFGTRLSVTFTSAGRGLFQILDTNNDGRLGVRELRNAAARLLAYDREGKGKVARRDIPQQVHLVVNPGGPNYTFAQPFAARPMPASAGARGPVWFRKMDRNGDGDLSPREFLGPPAEFRRLDTDGDGLISVEEAERADAALRRTNAR
jgi:Ca2+-binding EF-hand superfamily protein